MLQQRVESDDRDSTGAEFKYLFFASRRRPDRAHALPER
jgi:hypothetical protein